MEEKSESETRFVLIAITNNWHFVKLRGAAQCIAPRDHLLLEDKIR
jgi:hypothetical protein